jgi:hypothetical protein
VRPPSLWTLDPSTSFSAVPLLDLDEATVEGISRGESPPPGGLTFRRNNSRGKPTHLAYGGFPELLLVSRELTDALARDECTGWMAHPIETVDADDAGTLLSDQHAVLSLTGRAEVTRVPEPPTDEVYENRFVLPDGGWDGTDLCWSAAGALISERGRAALRKSKLGIHFTRLEDVRW